MRLIPIVALLLCGVAAGCAPRAAGTGPGPLATTLHAESFDDSVRFSLQVTNTSAAPVRLTFPTAQLFDFVVSQHGREVWRWSADRAFVQAVHELTLEPRETRSFHAVWSITEPRRGEMLVLGRLTGGPTRIEQQTRFHLH